MTAFVRTLRLTSLLAVIALAIAACGSSNKVGSGVKGLDLGDAAKRAAIEATSTTASPTTVANRGALGIGATSTTARPTTTSTPPTTQAIPTFDIAVYGDSGSTSQFDPSQVRVFKGTVVRWTNKDKVARSVEADTGAFNSGPIQPGATFTYKAQTPGSFNYHDGTRPYAVGSIEVINR
jgi:plastocyanin